jgi:hypothetical protein
MYDRQGGKCAVCNHPVQFQQSGKNDDRAVVDHCHKSGEVRAILCATCNIMLGKAKDSVDTLRAAADYLEKFNG